MNTQVLRPALCAMATAARAWLETRGLTASTAPAQPGFEPRFIRTTFHDCQMRSGRSRKDSNNQGVGPVVAKVPRRIENNGSEFGGTVRLRSLPRNSLHRGALPAGGRSSVPTGPSAVDHAARSAADHDRSANTTAMN